MSREYTEQEVREMFLDACQQLASYWANLPGKTATERCEGVLFSVMNIFDGTSGSFPAAIDLVVRPHPDDKQFYIDNGDNYIPDGTVINDCMLHELIFK